MAEIENEELQPLVGLEIAGHRDRGVTAGKLEAGLVLDRPKRIGLGHRAERLERLGDDAVDQRIDPDALVLDPAPRLRRNAPSGRAPPSTAARNALPLAGVNSHGKRVIGSAPARWRASKQFGELGRERPRRSRVRPVGGIGFVAAIGGVRHRAARLVEQALDLVPLRRGVDSARRRSSPRRSRRRFSLPRAP